MLKGHIALVGFMGSGKTCVSRRLSKLQKAPLIDVDAYIEQSQGKTINQIFAEAGEAGFRKIETETLASLAQLKPSIISCGGGIVCNEANRRVLDSLGTVVYLKVPLEEAINRISDPSTRPMLNGARPVQEIYDERQPLYEEVADITIESCGLNVYQTARAIEEECKKRGLL